MPSEDRYTRIHRQLCGSWQDRYPWRSREDARRAKEWLDSYQQKLRSYQRLGAIDPGPQDPRW